MIRILLVLFLNIFAYSSPLFAATSTFTIRPSSGNVVNTKNFTIDILINTNGDSSSLGRAVIKYDPEMLSVVKAERNSSLYCTYPEDQQSIDNTGGLLMITGFCQSGVGYPYKTVDSADVFARVTFKALKTGNATISWEYSGQEEPFKSAIVKDGSPPQMLLSQKPKTVTFKIVKSTSGTTPNPTPQTPNTGLNLSVGLVISGALLLLTGFMYTSVIDKRRRNSLKTIVDYGKKN